MSEAKHWRESKTIWFNVGTGLVIVGTEFAVVADFLSDDWEQPVRIGLAVLVAVGNVILRTVTSKPVRSTT